MARNREGDYSSPPVFDSQLNALKLPPHSVEAEQSLVGGLLLDNSAWDRVADLVSEVDFYRDEHRRIFHHIAKLIEQGKPADVVTVFESLDKSGDAQHVGGLAYLGEVANNTPSASNVRRYAEIVRERAILRKLVTVGDEIASGALAPAGRDANLILDEAESKILSIRDEGARQNTGFVPIQPVLGQVVERIQELYDRDNPASVTGVPTGLADLDKMTSGLHGTDMIIVAGRPGMGKTSFALNIAESVALDAQLPVAIFSMEMPATQLVMRFISSVGRLDQHRLRTGKLNDDEWQRLSYSLGKLHEAPIFIDETPGLNPIDLRARARRLHRQHGGKLGLIIIDYLQLMTSHKQSDNRTAEISEISRSVKSLAKELNVPIMALSQLNRSLEQRADKRPMASDLRESGALEQDADIIMFVYRDEIYNPDTQDKGKAELIIAKHRNGPTGMVPMTFIGEYTRFENYVQGAGY
ncbi:MULTISPECIES: replicative DNA helicase [unclassified Uliginosibacterium]|uniref:replicative DNA helicase n=1 Tax=unclassified Uliginosibacterium TaxID=2621521 RepID=UPI000C7D687E|nr:MULTISPECIES: replicative DNA helicase [unclassified Uliginosibacterium]MDO6387433.1 replicative DNA helicase [Uliginosibacterium sp. 31-12]PLK47060.1 replicative DNA helicase [Uliginosibacterium sp. TH139]